MDVSEIQLGKTYWIQFGRYTLRVTVIALPSMAELWLCIGPAGEKIACALTDFIGPASWI